MFLWLKKSYADHWKIREHIRFNTKVLHTPTYADKKTLPRINYWRISQVQLFIQEKAAKKYIKT